MYLDLDALWRAPADPLPSGLQPPKKDRPRAAGRVDADEGPPRVQPYGAAAQGTEGDTDLEIVADQGTDLDTLVDEHLEAAADPRQAIDDYVDELLRDTEPDREDDPIEAAARANAAARRGGRRVVSLTDVDLDLGRESVFGDGEREWESEWDWQPPSLPPPTRAELLARDCSPWQPTDYERTIRFLMWLYEFLPRMFPHTLLHVRCYGWAEIAAALEVSEATARRCVAEARRIYDSGGVPIDDEDGVRLFPAAVAAPRAVRSWARQVAAAQQAEREADPPQDGRRARREAALQRVVDAIRILTQQEGRPPTFPEIEQHLGAKPSTLYGHLETLQREGRVRKCAQGGWL